MDGFTAVAVSGTVFSDNVGGTPLLISNAGAADGSSPRGTGSYNVQVIGGTFSNNQGASRGGLALNSCGSALVSGSKFSNNVAVAQQVGQSVGQSSLRSLSKSLAASLTVDPVLPLPPQSQGGAVFAVNTSVYVSQCNFINNAASVGGAINSGAPTALNA